MRHSTTRASTFLAAILTALGAAACGSADHTSETEANAEANAEAIDELIGGFGANSRRLDMIGALALKAGTAYIPFCTGTLISERTVLTAEHCITPLLNGANAGLAPMFTIGANATTPSAEAAIVDVAVEGSFTGGIVGFGSDIAVVHLAAPIPGLAPMPVGTLEPTDVNRRLVAVGYGVRDAFGSSALRTAGALTLRGLQGKVYELAFGTFEAFKARFTDLGFGDITAPDGEARARAVYDGALLIPEYEALSGTAPGDAQLCFGDSGGPLVKRQGNQNTVVGVASWVALSGQQGNPAPDPSGATRGQLCAYFSVHATFGPLARALIEAEQKWQDPCAALPQPNGVCLGDVALRCSRLGEGRRRPLETDCALLGLSCVVEAAGEAGCAGE